MAVLGLLTMADTLAARATHRTRKHMYKHTDRACMARNEAVPTFRARLKARMNICSPSRAARGTLIDSVRSVHKCESSGTVTHVQSADDMCVMSWASG